jgi:Carboxypeptidase regulatory-like domain/TonB-dependent Receptor Plug Domain
MMMLNARRFLPTSAIVTVVFACASALHAQRRDGRVFGAVFDRTTGRPLAGVTVVNLLDGKALTTDTTGAFRFERLPVGIIRFLIRAPGFPQQGLVLALAESERMERKVELDSTAAARIADEAPPQRPTGAQGQMLAPVLVSEEASLGVRFSAFERRRKTGAGQYLVRADVEKMGANNLQDAVRNLRGVNLDCSTGGSGCQIRMARAPMRCSPEYIVDEVVDNAFGPTVSVRDIEGIEVYTGPADVPGEYAGRNAGCGVVVIWTRSGPGRKRR